MEDVVKFVKSQIAAGMSVCAAIRATAAQFIDVPRGELQKVLVEHCEFNVATIRTQVQLGRRLADAPALLPAPHATPAQQAPAVKKAAAKKVAKRSK